MLGLSGVGRAHVGVLLTAMVVFCLLTGWMSTRVGAWHEEIAVYPGHGYRSVTLAEDGQALREEPSCPSSSSGQLLFSRERPVWTACVGGRSWPVMVTSYIGGWIYWPAELLRPWHDGVVFEVRKLGVVLGLLGLFATFWIAARFASAAVAAVSVSVSAVLSPVVFIHAVVDHYEIVPGLALVGAVLAAAGPRAPASALRAQPVRRIVLVGALTGLALAANLKAALLLLPLLAFAVTDRERWSPGGALRWVVLALPIVVLVLPTLAFATLDPQGRTGAEVTSRLGNLASALGSTRLFREPLNLLTYFSDVGLYLSPDAWWRSVPGWVAAGSASTLVIARTLRPRPDDPPLVRVVGAYLLWYLAVAFGLYDQTPAANYAPIHLAFGLAVGLAVCLFAKTVVQSERGGRWLTVGLSVVAVAVFGFQTVRRGDPATSAVVPFNAVAERELTHYLLMTDVAGETLLTPTYNQAGVLDSLGRGRLAPVQVQHVLHAPCPDGGDAGGCMAARWARLLERWPGPVRVVTPSIPSMLDEAASTEHVPTLRSAATDVARVVTLERAFKSPTGAVVFELHRVARAADAPPGAP